MLPKLNSSIPYKDPLLDQNITHILTLPHSYEYHKESIVMVMSATCKLCHEKLDEIITKKKHLSHNLILYLESDDKIIFEEITKNISKKSNLIVFPLSKKQQHRLNIFLFPTFIHIDSQGIIKKFSTLADKAI
ncbi:hypothetical protein [Bacillus sp. 491mf]|uniref:hypothetical protein n=1 Tax=Bacillus sp. 491mf TaxID=1761755 RepID=UPI001C4325F2|nr:hypothetical protein [Bacillus sp. 491mf]